MQISYSKILFIIIISSFLGLIINHFNPKGISLLRTEKQLVWANDSSLNNDPTTEANNSSFDIPRAIELEQAFNLYKEGVVFIDAREKFDFDEGHIHNAVNIPYYAFDDNKSKLREINKKNPVVIYCAGTDCDLSILLANKLFELGYEKIYVFFGGWVEWQQANYPIDRIGAQE